jgi:ubiquinol-cytochrome c reductase cytochrome b subunit
LPFLIFGLVLLHLVFLHEHGSGNPLGIFLREDRIAFSPYFIIKDFLGFIIFCMLFSYLIFFDPNLLSHTDNYIIANPMVTPTHIVPE